MSRKSHQVWLDSAIGSELTENESRELYLISKRQHYEEGKKLFVEGDPAKEIFLILEGEVDVIKLGGSGGQTILATLGPRAILGEMSLLTREKRSATAQVRKSVDLLRIEWDDIEKLFSHHPEVAYKLIVGIARMMAGRLKRINAKVADMMEGAEGAGEQKRSIEEFAVFKKKLFSEWSF
jgi:CRP-like cAMP-binding protein